MARKGLAVSQRQPQCQLRKAGAYPRNHTPAQPFHLPCKTARRPATSRPGRHLDSRAQPRSVRGAEPVLICRLPRSSCTSRDCLKFASSLRVFAAASFRSGPSFREGFFVSAFIKAIWSLDSFGTPPPLSEDTRILPLPCFAPRHLPAGSHEIQFFGAETPGIRRTI